MKYTVEVTEEYTRWYKEGTDVLHREDGPAVEYTDGGKRWFKDGLNHREDGPAIVFTNGNKVWCINGLNHREDGPAIEWGDGTKFWYLNGKEIICKDNEEFLKLNQSKTCDGKIVEIEGKKYKLTEVK